MSKGQTGFKLKDTCHVDMPCPEFDFYARALVKSQELDTLTKRLYRKTSDQSVIISNLIANRVADSLRVVDQKAAVNACNSSYNTLVTKENKTSKKLKVFKNTTVIFGSVTVILVGLLLILIKH